jgi:inorganic phosphate transporter, PiT family
MTLIFIVILVALAFEYINGFHDTANSIATVVSTKVLTPRQAVILAAVTNLGGAMFFGSKVAKTITSGIVDSHLITMTSNVTICVLMGAIVWNLITWWFGLPSSSSHALIGGLCGGALAATSSSFHNLHWNVVIWAQPSSGPWYKWGGLLWKVVVPMIFSPALGFVLGFIIMAALYVGLRNQRPSGVNRFFGVAQIFSAGSMGVMHGANDAQKTMGIITLVLLGATQAGDLDHLPPLLSFLRTTNSDIALWIKVVCALTMAAGTAVGGWRIIKTLGHKMVKLHPINGFAAEASSAAVIGIATYLGIPVSTTHNIAAAIMGVGSARRFNAIKWTVVERMVWAWIFTIPVAAAIAYALVRVMQMIGWIPPGTA